MKTFKIAIPKYKASKLSADAYVYNKNSKEEAAEVDKQIARMGKDHYTDIVTVVEIDKVHKLVAALEYVARHKETCQQLSGIILDECATIAAQALEKFKK